MTEKPRNPLERGQFNDLEILISLSSLFHDVGPATLNAFGRKVLGLYSGTSRIDSLDDLRVLVLTFSVPDRVVTYKQTPVS